MAARGGKRPGAGRPPALATQLERAEALAKQLKGATEAGLSKLAEKYPELMEEAIELALSGDRPMLRELIRLLPSLTDMGGSSSTTRPPIAVLIQNMNQSKSENESDVAGSSPTVIVGTVHHIKP